MNTYDNMDAKTRRSYLFGELLAVYRMIDRKDVILTPQVEHDYPKHPGKMMKYIREQISVHYRFSYDSKEGKELMRICDELTPEDLTNTTPLEPVFILAEQKTLSKLRKERAE